MKKRTEIEPPIFEFYLEQCPTFEGRNCTTAETKGLIDLHDHILCKPDPTWVDPQLTLPTGQPHDPTAPVAYILFPLDPPFWRFAPRRVIVAIFCIGHVVGSRLDESVLIGRKVTAWAMLDNTADGKLWAEVPLYPSSPNIKVVMLLAIVFGIILAIGLVLLLEAIDKRFWDVTDGVFEDSSYHLENRPEQRLPEFVKKKPK